MTSDWYQQSVTPPDALELNIRVGVIPETDHVQALVELKDPLTGILLGQWSCPHRGMRQLSGVLAWALNKASEVFDDAVEPF